MKTTRSEPISNTRHSRRGAHVGRSDQVGAPGLRYTRAVSRAAVSAAAEGRRRCPGHADLKRGGAAQDHGADELSLVRKRLARLPADAAAVAAWRLGDVGKLL